MEYIIALWLVLFWEPLVKKIGSSMAWAWVRRIFAFMMIACVVFLLSFNLFGIAAYGKDYFRELVWIWENSDEHLRRDRENYWNARRAEKKRDAQRRYDEKNK
jgi:hypothetical protein